MKQLYLFGFCLLFCLIASTQISGSNGNDDFNMDQIYSIDASHSNLDFIIKYMGHAKMRGRFAEWSGTIRYDQNNIENTSATLEVKSASIDTDSDWRDKDLRSHNWFNTDSFPTITFVSNRAIPTTNGFDLIGKLSLKDVTKEVALHIETTSGIIKDIRGDHQVIFTGRTTINRLDYHVEGKNWSRIKEGITGVSHDVEIEFSIIGKQIQKENFSNFVGGEKRPTGKIYKQIKDSGLTAGIAMFEEMRDEVDSKVNANLLNIVAYMLLKEENFDDAIELFELNLRTFPNDPNLYDSMGEAYATAGKLKKAHEMYQEAISRDPTNVNAREVIRHLN